MEDNKEIEKQGTEETKPPVEEKKPVEETKPPVEEKKPVEENKDSKELDTLKTELAEAQKKAEQVETLAGEVKTLTETVTAKDSIIKEYEELIGTLVATKLEQVPEEYKELIPDNLDLKQQLNWLDKAEAKGLFTKKEKDKPAVEIGKPMNVEVPQVDTSKMTGSQLLKMAYQSIKK